MRITLETASRLWRELQDGNITQTLREVELLTLNADDVYDLDVLINHQNYKLPEREEE